MHMPTAPPPGTAGQPAAESSEQCRLGLPMQAELHCTCTQLFNYKQVVGLQAWSEGNVNQLRLLKEADLAGIPYGIEPSQRCYC